MRYPGRNRPRNSRADGFTLIELLVAIGVMALLAILSWRGLDGMTRAQAITQQRADEVLALEVGLAQWGADLDAMQSPPQTPQIHKLDWDGRALRLTRRDAAEPGAGLRVVAWTQRGAGTDGRWLRWQSVPVRSRTAWRQAWDEAGVWAQTPGAESLRQQIEVAPLTQWQIFYFRGETWTNPQSSADTMAQPNDIGGNTGNGPDGIRLVLTVAPGHALAGRLVRDWVRPELGGNKP